MSAPDFYLEAFPLEQGGKEAKHNNLAKIECSGSLKQLKCRVLYQRRRNYAGKEFQKLSIGISLSFRLNTKLHICKIRLHDARQRINNRKRITGKAVSRTPPRIGNTLNTQLIFSRDSRKITS